MSPRIAVVGANGRVGTELCLRLDNAGHDVVPIARNPGGSAFLRLHGLSCRHGAATDMAQARAMVSDCEVVVHLAYAVPRSREAHQANLALVRNVVEAAPPQAAVILASTIMVYAPTMPVRLPDAYGLEKLQLERLVRRATGRRGSRPFVFRIGHALGELQQLTLQVQEDVRAGRLAIRDGGARPSNTVFTATLAEAVARIAAGEVDPGTYDLISSPQWTWRDVYRFYGGEPLSVPKDPPVVRGVRGAMAAGLRIAMRQRVRERLLFATQLVPGTIAERAYGAYLEAGARRALAAPGPQAPENGGVNWRALPVRRPIPGLADPRSAAERYPLPPRVLDPAAWPDQIDS